jgi:hypothetical protein
VAVVMGFERDSEGQTVASAHASTFESARRVRATSSDALKSPPRGPVAQTDRAAVS